MFLLCSYAYSARLCYWRVNHPYLRAYMAEISVPAPLLPIALTAFFIARFVYNIPVPVERVIIFPISIIPNLFGVWNMLHLATRPQLGPPAYHTLRLHLFRSGTGNSMHHHTNCSLSSDEKRVLSLCDLRGA